MRTRGLVMLALVAVTCAWPGAALATAPRASLPDIEDEVMCVSCRIPLNIAESPQADRERAFIQSQIDRGQTKAQIKRQMVAQYGRDVLALPSDHGFGLTAYLVPIALVAVLLAGLALLLPSWRRRGSKSAATPAGPVLSTSEARRLDDDLARYKA